MKKLFAVLVALVLVLAMGTAAFAADTGSITITNAVAGETYEIYKILDFTPVKDTNGQKGYYTVDDAWAGFFAKEPASNYFKVEENADGKNVVSMKVEESAMDLPALAKAAVAYADTNKIAATATKDAEGTTVEFTGLALGYYAVDTSLGAICALTNTNSTETLVEKNAKPDITKEVQEDRDNEWGQVNDADIGQVVNYKSTVTVGSGLTDYVMHDKMDAGLTFDPESVVVEGATEGEDYTLVTEGLTDGCTFEIRFADDFIATFAKGATFEVTYSATLNENAKVAHDKESADDYEGNKNTAQLTYKNENEVESSEEHKTVTFTWKLDVFKYTKDGDNKTPLAGAIFQLEDAEGEAIKFSPVDGVADTYVVDPNGTADIITTDTGVFYIIGLDEGTYTLVETQAPDGYNRAKDTVVIIGSELDQGNYAAEYYFVETDENGDTNEAEPETIEVENKTGGLFPETGGIGTTIFYIVGALLMLAAIVVLISKKRMATFA